MANDDQGLPPSASDLPDPEWNSKSRYILENQLPLRLEVKGDHGYAIRLAPLERREVSGASLEDFARTQLEHDERLVVSEKTQTELALERVLGLGFYVVLGYLWIGFSIDEPWFWFGVPVLAAVALLAAWMKTERGGLEILRWTKQAFSLLLVLITAVGIPGLVIWYTANVDELAQHVTSVTQLFGTSPAVLGRGLQLLVISTASLLPALMYFLFDREQLGTLRNRFLQQTFRFDPTLDRLSDLQAKYGAQVEEVYGTPQAGRARLLGGRLSPIFIATLLITIGWTVTLLNPDVQPDAQGRIPILELAQPERSVVTFAFLGAYFFAVQLVLRSYLRGDLRPKTYSHISVRILIVVILAWVLQEVVGSETTALLVLVFVAGVVPETAVRWVFEVPLRMGWSRRDMDALDEVAPLTALQGIDLYDRTRLMDEGVTNVEALAHHDFVDLMLRTRIPGARLVDWLDQAILYLHTRSIVHEADDSTEPSTSGDVSEVNRGDDLWVRVHRYGIRTATDLFHVVDGSEGNERTVLLAALAGEAPEARPQRLEIILAAMGDDEWLGYVSHWREQPDLSEPKELDASHVDAASPSVDLTLAERDSEQRGEGTSTPASSASVELGTG